MTACGYIIRRLMPQDVPGESPAADQINALAQVLSPGSRQLSGTHVSTTLEHDDTIVFVAREDDALQIVGMASLVVPIQLMTGKGWLEDVAVLPEYGGKGIGSRLIEAVIREANRRGISKLDLTSSNYRTFAQSVYARLGWVPRDSALMRLNPREFVLSHQRPFEQSEDLTGA